MLHLYALANSLVKIFQVRKSIYLSYLPKHGKPGASVTSNKLPGKLRHFRDRVSFAVAGSISELVKILTLHKNFGIAPLMAIDKAAKRLFSRYQMSAQYKIGVALYFKFSVPGVLLLLPALVHAATPTAYTLPPEKYQQAIEYSLLRYKLHFAGVALTLIILCGFIALRFAPRLREKAVNLSRRRIVQAFLIVTPLLLLFDLLMLPLEIYSKHLANFYGLSVQSWGGWLADWGKGEALNIIVSVPLIWLLYGMLRRWPRRAWLAFWLASVPLIALVVFALPVLIDPLFNNFTPLAATQPALVAEIGKITQRGGLDIPPERMFSMDASSKTNTLNAYVTGLGATKRVVVWDTTTQQMTQAQTLFVFGHEMGHYVLHHIYQGLALACAGSLLLFWLTFHSAQRLLVRYGQTWRIDSLSDWAALPLLLLLVAAFNFAGEPIANTYSRHLEHQADIYGLEVTHGIVPDNQQAAAEAFQILGEKSLAHPNPPAFIKFWLFSHPPIAERLIFAREYDPWTNRP